MREGIPELSPPPVASSAWRFVSRIGRALSLSRLQSIVAILAGSVTVVGAAFSIAPVARAAATGRLVAVVRAAGSQRAIPDATVEILTTENALVAALTPDATGRVSRDLREGVYVVRVSHPGYAADARRIDVQPRQTVEIKATLRAGSSSASDHTINVDRTVNRGVGAIRRALGF